jgi:hypothetical protein
MPHYGSLRRNQRNRHQRSESNGPSRGETNEKFSRVKTVILLLKLKKLLTEKNMNNSVSLTTIVGTLVRTGLAAFAGKLLTGEQVEIVAGAVTAIGVVGWSIWQKKRAARGVI